MKTPDDVTSNDDIATFALDVQGPFALLANCGLPCVLDTEERRNPGIYIWTVAHDDSELIHYVGETGRSFGIRFSEHLMWYLAGRYTIYDPDRFAAGERSVIWKPMFRAPDLCRSAEFLRQVPELFRALERQLRSLRLWLIPTDVDRRTRCLIEGAIARPLYGQPAPIGTFQEEGVRYQYRDPSEPVTTFRLVSDSRFVGIPDVLST